MRHRLRLHWRPFVCLSRARHSRGTVLVLALWIALGLVALALVFGQSARWACQAGENSLAGMQAEQTIEGARRYIAFLLENIDDDGRLPDPALGEIVAEAAEVGDGLFWLVGRDPDRDTFPETPVWGLVDEAAKLNLNTATLEMLEVLPGMTAELAAAIIDWRDEDDEPTPGGAESTDYEMLDPPYAAKNAPFESVEELRWIRGVDFAVLWGEDANFNGALDPNEDDGTARYPDDNADGRLDPGLAEYVTVWTREPNTRGDGSPKINLRNTESRTELRRLLEEALGNETADITMRRLPAQPIASPLEFFLVSGLSPEEFAKVEHDLTVTDNEYRFGLVNVRTASATVLACLPGMTEGLAQALVAERLKRDSTALASVAWVGDVLDEETARDIGPLITARSYQFSADIVAVSPQGRGVRRAWMVFDRGEDAVRVIYRRDRTRLGWPLGAHTREKLKETKGL